MKSILLIKTFFGLVEMMLGLVNVSFSLPEWQSLFFSILKAAYCLKLIVDWVPITKHVEFHLNPV